MTAPGVVAPPGPGWWVKRNRAIFPIDPTLVVTGSAPTIRGGPNVLPSVLSMALTGGTPIARNGNVLRPSAASTLHLTGSAPTVTVAAAASGFPYTFPIYFST